MLIKKIVIAVEWNISSDSGLRSMVTQSQLNGYTMSEPRLLLCYNYNPMSFCSLPDLFSVIKL